jgi:hypothetical protein
MFGGKSASFCLRRLFLFNASRTVGWHTDCCWVLDELRSQHKSQTAVEHDETFESGDDWDYRRGVEHRLRFGRGRERLSQ